MEKSKFGGEYIQIGTMASRNLDTGEFYNAIPIYGETTPELRQTESTAMQEVAKLFAQKFKQYIDECKTNEKRNNRSS